MSRMLSSRYDADMIYRFGIIALLLQLVPVIQMFFLLTTAAGAALWAVKLEQKRRLLEGDSTSVPSYGGEQRLYRNNPA